MLITGDKNMALFWSGLRARSFGWKNGASSCQIAPVGGLIPAEDLPDDVIALLFEVGLGVSFQCKRSPAEGGSS
jgi:hypothetical protein